MQNFREYQVHDCTLVANSLHVWQALTKALEKEAEIMIMVMDIGPTSSAWRALTKTAAEAEEVAYDRSKRDFDTLEIRVSLQLSTSRAHTSF